MTKDDVIETTLKKLRKEADGARLIPLANQIGIPYVTLWRILNGKSRGNSKTWHCIFRYYKR